MRDKNGNQIKNEMVIGNKKLAWVMLNMLEYGTGRKRGTIKNKFNKEKKSLSSYGDVWEYIKEYIKNSKD